LTSHRKRKKEAHARGLTPRELDLADLLEEVLEAVRWMQILGFSNQFLLRDRVQVSSEEQARVLEAATRAVDKDARLHEWRDRLARLKGDIARAERAVEAELGTGSSASRGGDATTGRPRAADLGVEGES